MHIMKWGERDAEIDLKPGTNWVAFAISGVIYTPVFPIGAGPDMYLIPANFFELMPSFPLALGESFASFGMQALSEITVKSPKLLLMPISDDSALSVKNALIFADMALAIFNKKVAFAKTRFLHWDRRNGTAVGVSFSNGTWKPLLKPQQIAGPAIVKPFGPDFWDWFFGEALRNRLPPLGERLFKCLEWERESDFSAHITHRFAFMWIGLEAMMPDGECSEGEIVRRYSLVAYAPSGSIAKQIMDDPALDAFSRANPNEHSKLWRKTIAEMYKYRCAILHDGSTDLNASGIDPKKVQWFYRIAKHLMVRVEGLAVNALMEGKGEVDSFWSDYVVNYLYSDRNHWLKNGTLISENLITFDWENTEHVDLLG